MSGNVTGGKIAAQTNKIKYGEDFYQRIGKLGGSKGRGGGFGEGEIGRQRARIAGKLGGAKSKRRKA